MRLSRLAILAALIYALVWFLILPPVDQIPAAVNEESAPAEVDPGIEITEADFVDPEALPTEEEEAFPDGERRIRVGDLLDEPAPKDEGPTRAERAARRAERAAAAGAQAEKKLVDPSTGGLPLSTLELAVEDLPEAAGPRPRVRLRPALDDERVTDRLAQWASTVNIPRIEDLFSDVGQAVSEEGTLSVRVPANVPWILECGPGTTGPRASVNLDALQPGEIRAQVVSLADLPEYVRPEPDPEARAAREAASDAPRRGGKARNRGEQDAVEAVAYLNITAIGQDLAKEGERQARMWVRLDPGFGREELRGQVKTWAEGQEGALPDIFGEGYVHRRRGPLRVLVPPGVPFEVVFGQNRTVHGKVPIDRLLPGESRTLAVALLGQGTPITGDTEVATAPPAERREPEPDPLEVVPFPEVQQGTSPTGTPLHSSRRGAERLREPISPPPLSRRPGETPERANESG